MRVGFDLDGVLFDFGKSVREYMDSIGLKHGWENDALHPQTWNFFEHWGMTTKDFVQLCHDGVDAGYIFRNNVRNGAVEAVEMVKDMGHEIIVITDRQFGSTPEKSHQATYDWWEDFKFPAYDELHFSSDKTSVYTDIFVEDKLENYDAVTAAGTECYLINRPWNFVEGCERHRLNGILEYPAAVFDHSIRLGLTVLVN